MYMYLEESTGRNIEVNSFVAVNLNETGIAEEFIGKVKAEIEKYNHEEKYQFLKEIINAINREKDWHNNLCTSEKCKVKEYFDKCLSNLNELVDQNVLSKE
jgi:GDP-D-mannose dehydratase